MSQTPGLAGLTKPIGGIAQKRRMPRFEEPNYSAIRKKSTSCWNS